MRTHWISAAIVVVASLAAPKALAEPWVDKTIADREHDFGTVARGSDTVYRFPVKNIYKQDIELRKRAVELRLHFPNTRKPRA